MGATPNRVVGGVLGAVYIVVGIVGFFVNPILVFQVNAVHNVVHLLVGALLLVGAFVGEATARAINLTVGAVYLILGIIGFFVMPLVDLLALNTADHFLHLGSGIVLLAVGLASRSRTAVAR